jgi:hypothetical protein
LNTAVKNTGLADKIFAAREDNFCQLALELFHFQYRHNPVYGQYCRLLHTNPALIKSIEKIPFLPIGFFKTHTVAATIFDPVTIFESSGTTQSINSRHCIKDLELYKKSFTNTFHLFYGNPADYCIIGLLPSYLERNNSSLVWMVDELIKQSRHPQSGFYLNDLERLHTTLVQLEKLGQKTLLIGVTFALLDFAEKYPMPFANTIIMETGGMKGRKTPMTRQQVHEALCGAFQIKQIHSEYGMTELLSQAYSNGNGVYNCPPWMKVLIRDEDDPLTVQTATANKTISGAINVIDLANIYSAGFIATEDAGKLYTNGSFEVLGRLDNTDIRGCSLLSL